jgi:alpha-L-fucosidase 2
MSEGHALAVLNDKTKKINITKHDEKMKKSGLLLFFVMCCLIASWASPPAAAVSSSNKMVMWHNAAAQKWTNAYPMGNGRLGALLFGGVAREQIVLNEQTLWAGSQINNNNPETLKQLPEIRRLLFEGKNTEAMELATRSMLGTPPRIRSYQPVGLLELVFDGDTTNITNYRRELNFQNGTARVSYTQSGNSYVRECFVSAPADMVVFKVYGEKKAKVNARIKLSREKDATVTAVSPDQLVMTGQIVDKFDPGAGEGGAHMKFGAILKVRHKGGSVTIDNNQLVVKDAAEVELLITAATDYNLSLLNFDRSIDPGKKCQSLLKNAEALSYSALKTKHTADFEKIFKRVEFNISGKVDDQIPTDQRLKAVKEGAVDPFLTELYFQFGRYLLMSSSRAPGTLPANLQGLWNPLMNAPWNADFHTNINLQMNYWPSNLCNLDECNRPLTEFVKMLTVPGRKTAKEMYGADGWTIHHLTDPFGRSGLMDAVQSGIFPMGGPWITLHLWQRYQYTGDLAYLKTDAYPVMKESAKFILGFLIPDPEGHLVTSPSYSPENSFLMPDSKKRTALTYGPTIDNQIIIELFNACIQAGKLLKEDPAFSATLEETLKKLPPVKVGKLGTVQEWIKDYDEAEPGHRHMSQLFGLHPGTQITTATPELFKAAQKTIERRLSSGGGHTGWSRAWIINFYARLLNGDEALKHIQLLFAKSTLDNLWDNHPPFQIDGNFGATAGIAEMLLQSHQGQLVILPALPSTWKEGHINGLKAIGNFEVSVSWQEGQLANLTVKSNNGGVCKLNYAGKTIEFNTKPGEILKLNKNHFN